MLVLFVRAIILYIVVFVVIRMTGKRQISDLQPFDLVITLLIADLATDPIADTSIPLVYGVLPILAMFLIQRLVAYLSLKSAGIHNILSGKPILVIVNGVMQEDEMRKNCYTINDLLEQLRAKDTFDISEVAYAIVETDGSLSVLKKDAAQTPTKSDLHLKTNPAQPCHTLILDGKTQLPALDECGHTERWLQQQLLRVGQTEVKHVFYASLAPNGQLYLQPRMKQNGGKAESYHIQTGAK
ncbi:MAG: DUF421 domain-containing protein [Eubacteriales bacterium]|nr:DUF421 domain-containing protein [Eubacteriales bacterium]